MSALLAFLLATGLTGEQATLGFNDCSPTLFRKLPIGEVAVSISQVGYDSFGRVVSFLEEVAPPGGRPSTESKIAVIHDPGGSCPKTKYTVETAGRRLASTTESGFSTEGLDGQFAFTAKGIGGIVVVGPLEADFETGFAYDSFGRRRLARQAFTYGGIRYEVSYSSVVFDDFGRLSGYRAALKGVPTK